jgi:hypothetical protein
MRLSDRTPPQWSSLEFSPAVKPSRKSESKEWVLDLGEAEG